MTDDSGAVTKLEIQKLRKNLDAKHRVSFIGGSSSRHLRDLKTAVDNYLNFMDGKPGFKGTDETEMLYIVYLNANGYVEKKMENVPDEKRADWHPDSRMGQTRFNSAQEELNAKTDLNPVPTEKKQDEFQRGLK